MIGFVERSARSAEGVTSEGRNPSRRRLGGLIVKWWFIMAVRIADNVWSELIKERVKGGE